MKTEGDMSDETISASRALAERIATDLMTTGDGELATRMQMMQGTSIGKERVLGGRNWESMVQTIQKHEGIPVIELTLPFPPSVNTYYRNITIAGRARTVLSSKAREYRTAVESVASVYMTALLAGVPPTMRRLSASITLHAPTRRKYDIDNRIKAVLDALEHVGVFADDEQIDRLTVIRGDVRPRSGAAIVQLVAMEGV